MKFILSLLSVFIISAATATVHAESDYDRQQKKAERFFDNEEWASANAMYILMLEQDPKSTPVYARSIVANIMNGDTLRALEIVPQAMNNEVPFDSLMTDVRKVSFSIGHGDLYENYLLGIKNSFPWLSRVADNYLMQYYSFRKNGPELVRYARTMLAGLPDNRNFLRMLAQGELLSGNTGNALKTWLKVVSLNPDDYQTILDLANCYDAQGDNHEAFRWMKRAYELHPTPYVETRIDALGKILSLQ